jgi:hypothetical protein
VIVAELVDTVIDGLIEAELVDTKMERGEIDNSRVCRQWEREEIDCMHWSWLTKG